MKKYSLIRDNNKSKAIFIGGITALALTLQLGTINTRVDDDRNSLYNKYSTAYIEAMQGIDYSQYDDTFIDIYRNGIYNIAGDVYSIDEVYMVVMEDGSKHLIKASSNDVDILSKEKIIGKKKKIVCLKNTSLFYYLYQDGLVIDKNIALDLENLKRYVDSWDGKLQNKIPELKAQEEARESIKRK